MTGNILLTQSNSSSQVKRRYVLRTLLPEYIPAPRVDKRAGPLTLKVFLGFHAALLLPPHSLPNRKLVNESTYTVQNVHDLTQVCLRRSRQIYSMSDT